MKVAILVFYRCRSCQNVFQVEHQGEHPSLLLTAAILEKKDGPLEKLFHCCSGKDDKHFRRGIGDIIGARLKEEVVEDPAS